MKNQFIEIPVSETSIAKRGLIFGVGINDANYLIRPYISGTQSVCPFYLRWISMLKRCYSDTYQSKKQTYVGCSVCSEWLLFSRFKGWMATQDWEGKDMDKDIISPGNKIYSPLNCAFVDRDLNNLLTNHKAARGLYPQGVSAKHGKYRAQISLRSKMVHLGTYETTQDAEKAYRKAKHDAIMRLVPKQSDQRIKDGLKLHALMYLNCEVK